MLRQKLLEQIETVEPALSSKDTLPILSHLWFTGRHVMAFNDSIAITAGMPTEFKAAVPPMLAKLLRASMAGDADLKLNGHGELQIKLAASRISLPTLPPEDFSRVFKMPEIKKADDDKIIIAGDHDATKTFLTAIDFASQCVTNEATVADQLGISLLPAGSKAVAIYATNEKALFYCKTAAKNTLGKRVILSAEFCKQMANIAKKDLATCALYIHADSAVFKAGDAMLFGKLINSENPLDFDGVLKRHFPDIGKNPKLADVPAKMSMIIDRAVIVTNGEADSHVTVKDGKMQFRSQLAERRVDDIMTVRDQEDISIKFSPIFAKLALDAGLDRMRLTKNCVIFNKDDLVFLVTAKA